MITTVMTVLTLLLILFLLYLLAIMPRMLHKPDDSSFRSVYYAHRGLHDNRSDSPENSIPAFQKAVDAGYGIELDVQLTKDEKVVVFHDNTLKRVCGVDAPVNSMTYEELKKLTLFHTKEQIPLFSEVLEIIGGKVPLIMEIKMVNAKTRVCELANEALRHYPGVCCMESFHPAALLWYKKHRPSLIRGQLSAAFAREGDNESFGMFLVHNLLTNFLTKPDFIAYSSKSADAIGRRICRSLYKNLAVAWTIRSQKELDEAKDKFDLFIFEGFLPRS